MGVVPSHPYRQARGDGSFMGPAGGTEAGSSSPVGQAGRVHGHVSRSRAMACEVDLLATAITSPLLSRNRKGSCSAGRGGLSRVGGKGGGGVCVRPRRSVRVSLPPGCRAVPPHNHWVS